MKYRSEEKQKSRSRTEDQKQVLRSTDDGPINDERFMMIITFSLHKKSRKKKEYLRKN